jgi:hypothetical protein
MWLNHPIMILGIEACSGPQRLLEVDLSVSEITQSWR